MSYTWVDMMGAQVKVDGRKYVGRYVEAGSGEPLILLHGQGGHVENFSRNIMVYARYFHVFALDACWHGYGPQPEFNPQLLPTYVDHVLDFIDWQGFDSVHVEGQSMGGWTAMRLAHDHPEKVRKLVLTTTQGFQVEVPPEKLPPAEPRPASAESQGRFPYLDDPNYENIRARVIRLVANPENMTDEIIAIRQKIYKRPETNASLRKVAMNYLGPDAKESRQHLLGEQELREIKAETFVYWGEKNSVPPPYGERLAELIPNCTYYCRPNTGHWAQFEGADDHNREVLRFLTGDASLTPPGFEEV